ncbi:plasmid stabilization system family protein [Psychroflexus torquis ATCC 700755]|uniref:Plasmid stabilization system family protein n=1 Tax=Psychroflexus torquis (strain ATCC 700755 / CIP 106069 / ACAM 623) TaxID=313595 RepID=K4IQR7_PSYTT|nr:type II toxin-antitoxin system RelE/ParE family toxin [Psychroflexus torquis]AFU67830.1 plasmid stabilization system family protein [Psychroflexus torquis ATCC 700755]
MIIIWTDFAIKNLKDIFDYYSTEINKKIAHKIRREILQSTNQLKNNSELGQIEFNLEKLEQNHRYLVCGNYKVIYRVFENQVIINDVFDTRQDPEKMNDEKRKFLISPRFIPI